MKQNTRQEVITEKQAEKALEKNRAKAEKLLQSEKKFDDFIIKLEKKVKECPLVGEQLSYIPALISMLKSYAKKEYTEIPVKTIVAIVAALLYWVSPIDLIPDFFPGLGYLDDVGVLVFCLKLVGDDVKDYINWRDGKDDGDAPKA